MSKRVRVTWTETITFSTDVFVPDDREGDQTEREYALRAVRAGQGFNVQQSKPLGPGEYADMTEVK